MSMHVGSGDDAVPGRSIHGDNGDNALSGASGDDSIYGDQGNDSIDGAAGDDALFGGIGSDSIAGASGDDHVEGGQQRDTLTGGSGNDTLVGGNSDDTLQGGQGADYLYGGNSRDDIGAGSGDDHVYGGNADDTIRGGQGDDFIDGGNGRNLVFSGSGDDTVHGGNASDHVSGGAGADYLEGGNSRDTLVSGSGDDTILGGEGEDSISSGAGDDSIFGGNSRDTIEAGSGDDFVDAGGGEDRVEAGAGDDTVYGGQGQDTLFGGSGDDLLNAGDEGWNRSTDTLYGGAGQDTLESNGNQDRLYGGSGDDVLRAIADGSNLNNLYIAGGEDADDGDWDVLDLSQYYARYPGLQVIYESGAPGDENARILLKTASGQELGRINYSGIEQVRSSDGAICFTPGSLIATMRGEIPVEELRPGDRVITRDNGMQELRWTGRRHLDEPELAAAPNLQPILVRAGALGQGLPHTDLVVSPQHRMLIRSDRASLLYEESEVLVAARDLVGIAGVDRLERPEVTYHHLLFDRHEVILGNGAWSESFQPGAYSMTTLDAPQRDEILYLFPELAGRAGLESYSAARRSLKRHEARVLCASAGLLTAEEPTTPADAATPPMPRAYRGP